MKIASWACAVGLAVLSAPGTAEAKGIIYDCDTAANHFSELILPVEEVPFTVSGNVKLNALAGSTTYAPLTRIQIASSAAPGQSSDVYAGFTLTALAVDAKKTPSGEPAIQMLSFNFSGKKDEVIPLSLRTKPGTVQAFSLSYDGNKVLVTLGTESKSFPIKTSDPVVRLVCSTGEFLFTDLTIMPSR
ncbi:hypothetical protein WSK_2113 [Novosphingobium sp. Rr 2-17]|uniref:hypothetical protein n=1 Tax=Novosphingobium sp. Rr 2-17 TaxID=555793 RepID=UPI0002698EC6|nr:hypothetical protein [Novosphingobium sp. Rr 2-17]EIZ79268.1 hypothetical protein WSK_2113 [Novosphingobium sp. Rr 2-17]